MSTNFGFAPAFTIAVTVGTAVFDTVMTSSPFPILKAFNAIKIASVQLPTPSPNFVPIYLEKFFSNVFN